MALKRGLYKRPKLVAYLCERYGVTEDELRETVRLRKLYKQARYQRMRRHPGKKVIPRNGRDPKLMFAYEGALDAWLRALDMTPEDFCRAAGVSRLTYQGWSGHPLLRWPVRFLELYAWARNMEAFIRQKGYDPETMRGSPVTEYYPEGKYPRDLSKLQLTGLTAAEKHSINSKKGAAARWGKKDPEHPWKRLSTSG